MSVADCSRDCHAHGATQASAAWREETEGPLRSPSPPRQLLDVRRSVDSFSLIVTLLMLSFINNKCLNYIILRRFLFSSS